MVLYTLKSVRIGYFLRCQHDIYLIPSVIGQEADRSQTGCRLTGRQSATICTHSHIVGWQFRIIN